MAFRPIRRIRELLDVDLSGIADGDTLVYDAATGTFVPGTPGGEFTPVACVLEAFPVDVHAVGVIVDCKWTALFNNPKDFTPLVAIPAGLGLTFVFDGSSATITTTEQGTWALTLGANVPQDATWEGIVTLDGNTLAAANCPVPPSGQSANVLVPEIVPVPAGYAIAPSILTTAAAAANPLNADVYLNITRLAG